MKRKTLGLLAALAVLASCGQNSQENEFSNLDSDVGTDQPELGQAYNGYTDEFIQAGCVDIPKEAIKVIPPKLGVFRAAYNMSKEDVLDSLNGDASAKIDMKSLKAEGAIAIANKSEQ